MSFLYNQVAKFIFLKFECKKLNYKLNKKVSSFMTKSNFRPRATKIETKIRLPSIKKILFEYGCYVTFFMNSVNYDYVRSSSTPN